MIYKNISSLRNHLRVTFELPANIWADRIWLVGDFNDWQPGVTPMRQERDAVWRATLDLPLGKRYEFRYIIDGQWQSDCHADGFMVNDYGSDNSIVDATAIPAVPLIAQPTGFAWSTLRPLQRSSRTPLRQRSAVIGYS